MKMLSAPLTMISVTSGSRSSGSSGPWPRISSETSWAIRVRSAWRQRGLLGVDDFLKGLADLVRELGLLEVRVVEPRAEVVDERLVDPSLDLRRTGRSRVARRRARGVGAGDGSWARRAVSRRSARLLIAAPPEEAAALRRPRRGPPKRARMCASAISRMATLTGCFGSRGRAARRG